MGTFGGGLCWLLSNEFMVYLLCDNCCLLFLVCRKCWMLPQVFNTVLTFGMYHIHRETHTSKRHHNHMLNHWTIEPTCTSLLNWKERKKVKKWSASVVYSIFMKFHFNWEAQVAHKIKWNETHMLVLALRNVSCICKVLGVCVETIVSIFSKLNTIHFVFVCGKIF